jgi:hypothetical protein
MTLVQIRQVVAALALTGLVGIGLPMAAQADVLVSVPSPRISCGHTIKTGVWYQSFSGGPRRAVIQMLSYRKRVIVSKRVTATTTWRYFDYTPRCARHYYVRYRTPGGTSTFRVYVKP